MEKQRDLENGMVLGCRPGGSCPVCNGHDVECEEDCHCDDCIKYRYDGKHPASCPDPEDCPTSRCEACDPSGDDPREAYADERYDQWKDDQIMGRD